MVTFTQVKQLLKANKVASIFVGVMASAMLAYAGWWAWMEWRPIDPTAALYEAMAKGFTSPANAYKIDMSFTYNTGLKAKMSSTVRLTSDAAYVQVKLTGGNSLVDATYSLETILGKEGIYLRPSSSQLFAAIMAGMGSITPEEAQTVATELTDAWLYVSYDEIRQYDQAKPFMRCYDSLLALKVTDADQKALMENQKNSKAMTVGKRLADETIGGESSRRFELSYNVDAVNNTDLLMNIPAYKHIADECADLNTWAEATNKANGVSVGTIVYRQEGQVWLGKYSGELTKMTQHIVSKDTTIDMAVEAAHRPQQTTQLPLKSDTISLDEFLHYDDSLLKAQTQQKSW